MKKLFLIILLFVIVICSSCSRYFTPEYAANNKMKCGQGIGKRN
jgi:hypothetical protein